MRKEKTKVQKKVMGEISRMGDLYKKKKNKPPMLEKKKKLYIGKKEKLTLSKGDNMCRRQQCIQPKTKD